MLNLSIVIPYHNNLEQLERLLESIPNKPWLEVIIVNDHSDKPLLSVNHLGAKILQQVDGKRWAGAARNMGLLEATGKYVLFADSDDYFTSSAFSRLEKWFGDDDIVFFRPSSIKDDGSISNRHIPYQDLVDSYLEGSSKDILYKFHVPWSKLYRREYLIYNDIFFDEVIASNDVNFSLKSALLSNSFNVSTDVIYCVVESSSSLTKKKSEQVIDSRFDALSRYNEFLKSIGDNNLSAMSGHLNNAMSFGFSKFMYRLFYCINRGYPLFYNISHVFRVIRHIKAKRRG